MKSIITAVIVAGSIVGGAYAGNFLKSRPAAEAAHGEDDGHGKKDSHGKEDAHAKKDSHSDDHGKKPKKKKKKGGHGEPDASDTSYFKFSREFIVPVMRREKVQSLVIININLEVDSEFSSKLFSMEPKLRDNIMTTLVNLSNDGNTLVHLTNVESYETIRSMILMNLNSTISKDIKNVLILDMAKQDVG